MPLQGYLKDLANRAASLIDTYSDMKNGPGVGKFPSGTLAIPGIRFSSDEDTGLHLSAGNTLELVANGVNKATVSINGLTLSNNITNSKKSTFAVPDAQTASTNRTTTLPAVNGTLATLAGTETLEYKTLTSPDINGGTISNVTLDGPVTGGGQNISGLGTLGCGAVTAKNTTGINFKAYYDDGRTSYTSLNYDGLATYGNQDLFITAGGGATKSIVFRTSDLTRMTLDASGNLLVGTTSNTNNRRLKVVGGVSGNFLAEISNTLSSGEPVGLDINYINMAPNNTSSWFIYCQDSDSLRMAVTSNGNIINVNNSYGAISDIKLKENITDATPKLDSLNQVRIVNYNLKTDPEHKQLGVIAQELEHIFPGMVEESPDYEEVTKTREVDVPAVTEQREVSPAIPAVEEVLDEEGNVITPAVEAVEAVYETVEVTPATTRTEEYTEREATGEVTKSVKYSVFVPMLIKAVQELSAKNDALEARLVALEAA